MYLSVPEIAAGATGRSGSTRPLRALRLLRLLLRSLFLERLSRLLRLPGGRCLGCHAPECTGGGSHALVRASRSAGRGRSGPVGARNRLAYRPPVTAGPAPPNRSTA